MAEAAWGIEVGADAIKALKLAREGDQLRVLEFEVLPFKEVLTTPELNVHEAIQVNLDQLVSRHELNKAKVVVSVPGHLAFARFANMPPVPPKEVPNIVRYEAVQQIPFPIEQVEWDYQVFESEDSPEVGVGIFAITKERVQEFISDYEHVGVNIDELTLSPLAVYNAFYNEQQEQLEDPAKGVVYLDIGSQSTDVIIASGGGIWLRTLPIGGNNFTEALQRAFKLSFSKAEKLKKEAGTSKYSRQIFQAMRPVFADLVQELQRSLGYYQSMNRDVELEKVVGVGSTFRLPGLRKFLQQQLQMDVERVEGFHRLEVEGKEEGEFTENSVIFATAYGLALQGLGLDKVSANILPTHMLQARIWKRKRIWFHAAAALLLIGALLALGISFMAGQAYESGRSGLDQRIRSITNQVQQALDDQVQLEDPANRVENFRRMLDYRDLWPKLMQDISLALASVQPQPELLEGDYEQLLESPLGKQRAQWRRLYIEQVDVAYVPQRAVASEPGPNAPQPMDVPPPSLSQLVREDIEVGQFWSEDPDQPYLSYPANPSMQLLPPRYEVRITGTSPNAQTATLLDDTLLDTLRDAANQPDRPYRLVVKDAIDLVPLRTVETTTERNQGRSRSSSRSSGLPPRPGAGALPPRPGAGGLPARPGRATTSNQQGEAFDLQKVEEQVVPENPLAEVDRSNDWRFTISFEVELKKPREARKAALVDDGQTSETDEGDSNSSDSDQQSSDDEAGPRANVEDSTGLTPSRTEMSS